MSRRPAQPAPQPAHPGAQAGQHAAQRSCKAVGVCQQRHPPAPDCNPACLRTHRAAAAAMQLHQLHRVTAAKPQPHTPPLHACQADQCRQGRAPCPVPQACEVPAPEADLDARAAGRLPRLPHLYSEHATPLERAGIAIVFMAAAAFAAAVVVFLMPRA